ncbi:MAG: hypothetical protein KDD35_04185, partial [Bdellovibrionales bacterium]|nr:hypothetical protein [Bdellovibrionales bacterium]
MTFCQVIESSVSKVLLCSVAFVWLTIGDLALAADWTRINEDIVFGSGKIEIDEFQRFRKVYDCRVREVVLEHLGGSVVGSMDIADQILKDEVSVRVVGACLSSCANYLFLAGKKKTIAPGGLVGFHGSPFAGTLLLPNWTSVFAKKAKGEGHSEVEVLHGIELRRELFNREERFFDQVGIDIRLLTNSIDGERSRRVYKCSQKSLYLFPTKAKLEAYGVKN